MLIFLVIFFTFFFKVEKMTEAFRPGERGPLFWLLTPHLPSAASSGRGKGWQTSVTGQGEL